MVHVGRKRQHRSQHIGHDRTRKKIHVVTGDIDWKGEAPPDVKRFTKIQLNNPDSESMGYKIHASKGMSELVLYPKTQVQQDAVEHLRKDNVVYRGYGDKGYYVQTDNPLGLLQQLSSTYQMHSED